MYAHRLLQLTSSGQLSADVGVDAPWPSTLYAQDQGTPVSVPPLSADHPVNASQGTELHDHPLAPTPYSPDPLPYPAFAASPTIEYLEQGTYQSKQPVGPIPAGPMYFNKPDGVLLAELESLANGDDLVNQSAIYESAFCHG